MCLLLVSEGALQQRGPWSQQRRERPLDSPRSRTPAGPLLGCCPTSVATTGHLRPLPVAAARVAIGLPALRGGTPDTRYGLACRPGQPACRLVTALDLSETLEAKRETFWESKGHINLKEIWNLVKLEKSYKGYGNLNSKN